MKFKVKIALSTIIASVIFTLGVLVGIFVTDIKIKGIIEDIEVVKEKIISFEVSLNLMYDKPELLCQTNLLWVLSEDLDKIAAKLAQLDATKSIFSDIERIERTKDYYFSLELLHYSLVERMKEICGKKWHTILFFYGKGSESKDQGIYLTLLKQKYPEKVYVYSFKYDTNSTPVKLLIRFYEVYSVPTLVIDGVKHEGLLTLSELEQILELR